MRWPVGWPEWGEQYDSVGEGFDQPFALMAFLADVAHGNFREVAGDEEALVFAVGGKVRGYRHDTLMDER